MTTIIPKVIFQEYTKLVRVIESPIKICEAFRFGMDPAKPYSEFKAIWDTGATISAISKDVINNLKLKRCRVVDITNCHGIVKKCDAFLINVVLPCEIGIQGILATEGDFGTGIGALIGMDIISHGDFTISNFDSKTTFSFRIPSAHRLKLVAPHTGSLAGRNDKCPCGSGKKYKNCCID